MKMEVQVEYDYEAQESDELTIRKGDVILDVTEQDGGWWEGSLRGKRGMFPDNFVKVIRHGSKIFSTADKVSKPVIRKGAKSRRCKVLYSYAPAHEDELELKVDDLIEFMEEIEEGWWKGQLRGKIGVFPSNFVENQEDTGGGSAEEEKKEVIKEEHKVMKPSTTKLPERAFSLRGGGGDIPDDKFNLATAPAKFAKKVPTMLDEVDIGVPKLPPKPVKEQARVLFAYEALNDDELQLKEGDIITVIAKDIEDKGWWKGELNGKVGVFPDNFVVPIPVEEVKPKKPEKAPEKSATRPQSGRSDFSKKPPPSLDLPPPTKKDAQAAANKKAAPVPTNKKPAAIPPAALPNPTPVTAARDFQRRDPTLPLRFTNSAYSEHNGAHAATTNASGDNMQMDFDSIERHEMLTHPTASRAKAPKRRPPSSIFGRDMEVGGVMNGNAELENGVHHPHKSETDEDRPDGESDKEKKQPPAPWMEELKMSQARRTKELSPGKEERFPDVFMRTDSAEVDRRAPPLPSKPPARVDEDTPEVPQRKLGWNKQPKLGLRNSVPPEKAEVLHSKSKAVVPPAKPKATTPTMSPPPIPTESAPSEEELRAQVKVLRDGQDRLQAQLQLLQEELENQQREFATRLSTLGEELRREQKLRLSLEEKLDHLSSVV